MALPEVPEMARRLVVEPLSRTRLFEQVSAEGLEKIAARTVRLFFRKGDVIVHQGEPGDRMFVVIEGSVQVYITSPESDHEEVVLSEVGSGDTFGELTLLDGEPRSASVRASTPTVLFALGRIELTELMASDPALVQSMLQGLARTVRRLTDQTSDAVFFDVHQRVAALILDLAREKVGDKNGVLQLDLRRTEHELADTLGRSRQSVAEVLKSFQQMGCLELRDHVIYVNDPDILRQQLTSDMTWAELANRALHDPLTQLANRRLFGDRVVSAISRARRQHSDLAVLFIDLDDFKLVNDVHGHAAGDLLLSTVADRLRSCLRATDTAARFGGDEFGVLLEDVAGPNGANISARRILAALNEPYDLGEHTANVGASIGLAITDAAVPIEPAELFHQADTAMYQAKQAGKRQVSVYEPPS